MPDKEYNNDFFGWNGFISRKNYAINIFIVSGLFIALSLVNFNAFEPYIPIKFLLTVLIFAADLLRLVLVMCALSLVYRRTADFSVSKSYKVQSALKHLFILFFVFPVLYILCARHFLAVLPSLTQITDFLTFFILIPAALLLTVIICFIKGKNL